MKRRLNNVFQQPPIIVGIMPRNISRVLWYVRKDVISPKYQQEVVRSIIRHLAIFSPNPRGIIDYFWIGSVVTVGDLLEKTEFWSLMNVALQNPVESQWESIVSIVEISGK